jgi:hypothetical protein
MLREPTVPWSRRGPAPAPLPLLIQVPLVAQARTTRSTAAASRRRRLRREVRLGATALLIAAPLTGLVVALRAPGNPGTAREAAASPVVSLSLRVEPLALAAIPPDPEPPAPADPPVQVQPAGYLLPEYPVVSVEEPTHAGR